MNKYVTIDSCIFVCALHESEEKSTACLKFLEQVNQGKYIAILPTIILVEVTAAIKRRTGSTDLALKARDFILDMNNISFVDIDYSRTMTIIDFVAKYKLRGMDAIIVGVAKEFNCGLATLDREVQEMIETKLDLIKI